MTTPESKTLDTESSPPRWVVYYSHDPALKTHESEPAKLEVGMEELQSIDQWKVDKVESLAHSLALTRDGPPRGAVYALRRKAEEKAARWNDPAFPYDFPYFEPRSMAWVAYVVDSVHKMARAMLHGASKETQDRKTKDRADLVSLWAPLSPAEYEQLQAHLVTWKVKNTGEFGAWCETGGVLTPSNHELWVFWEDNTVDEKYADPLVDVPSIIHLLAVARRLGLHVYVERSGVHKTIRVRLYSAADADATKPKIVNARNCVKKLAEKIKS